MRFTWEAFYTELARALAPYSDRQTALIDLLRTLRREGVAITPLEDKDETGRRFPLAEIDPFTFFGTFNRGITTDNRLRIAARLRTYFGIAAPVPSDFSGVPILNNQKSWLFAYADQRKPDDVPTLWRLFELALVPDPLSLPEFGPAFDRALDVHGVNINLTMGLFWIRPDLFLSVDGLNRDYAGIKLPSSGLRFKSYLKILDDVRRRYRVSFAELSHAAWLASQQDGKGPTAPVIGAPTEHPPIDRSIDYWMVGAYWDDREPPDQTDTFLREGIWQNGYSDKFTELVGEMKVGDRIAIKTAATQKEGLPFDARGRTVSRNVIKATGTITRNHGDGRTVDVEWEPPPALPRAWYFYTGRNTVWRLRKDDEDARRMIRFVFFNAPQDYEYFIHKWWDEGSAMEPPGGAEGGGRGPTGVATSTPSPYSIETAMSEGVFLSREELSLLLDRLETRRNVIIDGPPGVGKTFVAEKIAYALMEASDPRRVTKVQFHPSYSYEDFVRGFRPTDVAAKFELVDGPFLQACKTAAAEPDLRHVMLIDEINRGNTSQVFGELLMLIEADKRDMSPGITLLYPRSPGERFSVPRNLFIIATMNRADRTLALVDYALRRRFAFISLEPRFDDPAFRRWLSERKMTDRLVQHVITRMTALNATIAADRHLGREYQIGHSFFCPRGDDFSALTITWFDRIVRTEIVPLLEEYWYGFPEKVQSAADALLAS